MTKRNFIYFLAKYFGIAEHRGHYLIPRAITSEEELDDDRYVYYYTVWGIQIYPTFKLNAHQDLGWCSLYRDYIKKFVNNKKGGKLWQN